MGDPLSQAFGVVIEVQEYVRKHVTPQDLEKKLHHCDDVFEEAESLLLKGQSKEKIIQDFCKKIIALYKPLNSTSADSKEKEDEGDTAEQQSDNVLAEDSKLEEDSDSPVDEVKDEFSEETVTNSNEEDSTNDFAVEEPQPSCSGYKKFPTSVAEVTIDSDDDSVGSVECLHQGTFESSSGREVIVLEDSPDNGVLVDGEMKTINGQKVFIEGNEKYGAYQDVRLTSGKRDGKSLRKGDAKLSKSSSEIYAEAEELLPDLPFSSTNDIVSALKHWRHDTNRKYAVMSILIADAASQGREIPQSTYRKLESLSSKKRSLSCVDEVEEQPPKRKSVASADPADEHEQNVHFPPASSPQPSGFSITIDNRTNPPPARHVYLDPASHHYANMNFGDVLGDPYVNGDPNSRMQWSENLQIKTDVPSSKFFPDQISLNRRPAEEENGAARLQAGLGSHSDNSNEDPAFTHDKGVRDAYPARTFESALELTKNADDASDDEYEAMDAETAQNLSDKVPHVFIDNNSAPLEDRQEQAPIVIDGPDRLEWVEEKTALVASIIENFPVDRIAERVQLCYSDADIERVIDELLNSAPLERKDGANERAHVNDGAVAGPSGLSGPRRLDRRPSSSSSNDGRSSSTPSLVDDGVRAPGAATGLHFDDEVTSSINEDQLQEAGPSGVNTATREGGSHDDDQEDEEWMDSHVRTLSEMFPDADPEFLAGRCLEVKPDVARFEALVLELMETKEYPKMEDYLARKKRIEMRKKFIDGMTVPEFLELFEEPEKVFYDSSKKMSLEYRTNSRAQLLNDLPFHLSKDVDYVLSTNNFHYLPSLRALKSSEKYGRRKTKRKEAPISGEYDDFFLKELCYARLEKSIEKHRKSLQLAKEEAFNAAKLAGLLCECPICCEDEILEEDMRPCAAPENPHMFCKTCVKRYSEEQIGQGSLKFSCLEGTCEEEFSLNVLKSVLKSSVFSNLLKRKQAEEIVAAGITDLESCPFCNFATIMPNKEDKIFNCLNPECLKDTCRLCKELSHIPLRCEEVESKTQTSARTFLENQMSEAMVRECYKCGKRFIKEDGCNKMVCSCGAVMCYLCKKPIKGYDHFTDAGRGPGQHLPTSTVNGKCPLWSNSLKLHAEEVQKRAEEAKKSLDPDVQLKHDPTKDVPQVPEFLRNQPTHMMPGPPHRAPRIQAPMVNLLGRPLRAGNALPLEGGRGFHDHFYGAFGPHANYNMIADEAAIFADFLGGRGPEHLIMRPQPAHQYYHQQPRNHGIAPPAVAALNGALGGAGGAQAPPPPPPPAHGGAAPAAMEAGNWLQVQVNLDHRNLHNPRVEVQAGGAGNNHWEIQYNVLPRRGADPPPPPPFLNPPPRPQPARAHDYRGPVDHGHYTAALPPAARVPPNPPQPLACYRAAERWPHIRRPPRDNTYGPYPNGVPPAPPLSRVLGLLGTRAADGVVRVLRAGQSDAAEQERLRLPPVGDPNGARAGLAENEVVRPERPERARVDDHNDRMDGVEVNANRQQGDAGSSQKPASHKQ